MRNILTLFVLLIFIGFVKASPIGKGLYCNEELLDFTNFENFRGIFFESNDLVRVVGFKNKNNSLKIISKTTPYKISDEKIKFKIKFIWYGNISFENFSLKRQNLELSHTSNNKILKMKCEIVKGNFMSQMNNLKLKFQSILILNYNLTISSGFKYS